MNPSPHPATRGTGESPWVRRLLIALSLSFLLLFLILPLANVFAQAFSRGPGAYVQALKHPETGSAIRLTLIISLLVVPLNMVFGLAAAWCIAKFQFRGKALLLACIDLPFAVSPVVVGSMYLILFGMQGFLGEWLDRHGIQVLFALPGMVLVTLFITLPFVVREVVPVMEAAGTEQEQAALTLGASGWQVFRHVTLPSVRWGLLYGLILCNARAMGEFGAVSVVSGHIAGKTDTLPLRIEKLYQEYQAAGAFAVASLLTLLALLTLGIKTWLEWREQREWREAQRGESEAA
jgi:sulfate/thiosulfate transport system permease protein